MPLRRSIKPKKAKGSLKKIALIIPTRGGSEGVDSSVLVSHWREQTLLPDEMVVVRGGRCPACSRNIGAAASDADVLVFADDDGIPSGRRVLENVVEALNSDGSIRLSGAAMLLPPDSSRFQRCYAAQIGQSETVVQSATREALLVTTLCCAMRRGDFLALEGFDERLTAAEDPDLRDRIRRGGGKTVLAAGAGVFHPLPGNITALWRRAFWYARGEAQAARLFRGQNWRQETRPRGIGYVILKLTLAPSSLLLDWEMLKRRQIKIAFHPLRFLHTLALCTGYMCYRTSGAPAVPSDGQPLIEKLAF